jgi:hypothetical protein
VTDVPVYAEAVIGYREWVLNGWALTPLVKGPVWQPGVNRAACHVEQYLGLVETPAAHAVPGSACECGFYAHHEPGWRRRGSAPAETPLTLGAMAPRTPGPKVAGAIAAWGDLRVHRDGFRAEYAEIVALVRPRRTSRRLEIAAREIYAVPLVEDRDLEFEALQYGSPLPAASLPEE